MPDSKFLNDLDIIFFYYILLLYSSWFFFSWFFFSWFSSWFFFLLLDVALENEMDTEYEWEISFSFPLYRNRTLQLSSIM
jgi:hypothetical protein